MRLGVRNGFIRSGCRSLAAAGRKKEAITDSAMNDVQSPQWRFFSSPRQFPFEAFDHDQERKRIRIEQSGRQSHERVPSFLFPAGPTR
jgi:hypothetical protein